MTVRNIQSILYTPPAGTVQAGGMSDPNSSPLDDFTTLLASEITNEDPDNPVSSTDMVSQYAQINAAVGMDQLAQMSQTYQQMQTAADLLGQTVTVSDSSATNPGGTVTGKVDGLNYSGGTPQVDVDGTLYPLSSVTQVGQ